MESHRLLLGVIVVGIVFGALLFGKPSITGFVPTETYSQELNIDISDSQRFVLSSDESALKLSSLALTGIVQGEGLVNVYLSDGSNNWLVFSNKKKQSSAMEHITGLAVHELDIQPSERLDKIETLPAGYKSEPGGFQNECVDTCMLQPDLLNKQSLYLDVIIEPGTHLHISGMRFSTGSE